MINGICFLLSDYGPCPNQPCYNGGVCRTQATCIYYCQCPPLYSGQFCQTYTTTTSNMNLLALIIIPLIIASLLLLLCCVCMCRACCCVAPLAPKKHFVEVIEEEVRLIGKIC